MPETRRDLVLLHHPKRLISAKVWEASLKAQICITGSPGIGYTFRPNYIGEGGEPCRCRSPREPVVNE